MPRREYRKVGGAANNNIGQRRLLVRDIFLCLLPVPFIMAVFANFRLSDYLYTIPVEVSHKHQTSRLIATTGNTTSWNLARPNNTSHYNIRQKSQGVLLPTVPASENDSQNSLTSSSSTTREPGAAHPSISHGIDVTNKVVRMERTTEAEKVKNSASRMNDNNNQQVNNIHIKTADTSTMATTPNPGLLERARTFVADREQAYKTEGQHKHWKLRGHGHLYHYQKIILAAQVFLLPDNNNSQTTTKVVKIWNAHPETRTNFDQCQLLTIWVRVMGPEIVAGKAEAVPATSTSTDGCHWEFVFDSPKQTLVSGTYRIDAKVVFWNGRAPVHLYDATFNNTAASFYHRSQCSNAQLLDNIDQYFGSHVLPEQYLAQVSQNTSLIGFKFYAPLMSCCEICRRLQQCQYWSTPPHILPLPNVRQTGCTLYFDASVPAEDIPTTRVLPKIYGRQMNRLAAQQQANPGQQPRRPNIDHAWGSRPSQSDPTEVSQFIGCGWSFQYTLEHPCLSGDLDDHIFMDNHEIVVENNINNNQITADLASPKPDLPLCQPMDESLFRDTSFLQRPVGRWVRLPMPSPALCPYSYKEIDIAESNQFPVQIVPNNSHPQCWNREDLTPLNKNCLETNCDMIEQSGKWRLSPLQYENQWMGVWRNFACDYYEYTTSQLSQCFQARKIASVNLKGASIATHASHYFEVSLRHVTRYNDTHLPDKRTVTVTTLEWPHKLWRNNEDEWKQELERMPNLRGLSSKEEAYVISPFFVTSEREPYVQVDRALQFSQLAERILAPKGYILINAFDPSTAFSYDSSGQGDGLHIEGPPMRAIVMKVFHHMCSQVVPGSRV